MLGFPKTVYIESIFNNNQLIIQYIFSLLNAIVTFRRRNVFLFPDYASIHRKSAAVHRNQFDCNRGSMR
jgi:hypothetical protein